MKRITGFDYGSKIHLNDVTPDHIIVVYKENKPCGIIMYCERYWRAVSNSPNEKTFESLREALIWFVGKCEFYVLEDKEG